jgi:hypothetical protein
MKKGLLFPFLVFIGITFLPAQQIDNMVRDAVNNLASRLNVLLEVSIGSITLDNTETPSEFSRLLAGKVNHYATNNDLFRVIAKSRGIPSTRPSGPPKGTISGNFTVNGDKVTVTLELVSDSSGVRLGSQQFTLSLEELKKAGYEILPENIKTPQEAKEQEKIFTPVDQKPPVNTGNALAVPLIIKAWPNSDFDSFIEGDYLEINVVSNQNCFFKIYHIDINNDMQLIHPDNARDNELKANVPRTIGGGDFKISRPFGQDTIVVVASNRQFVNIEPKGIPLGKASLEKISNAVSSRGILVTNATSSQNVPVAETASVRFNFTSLPNTYFDEIYSYKKLENMAEAIQSMRTEIISKGGTFNGNEREGTFTVGGITGNYSVTGDQFIVRQRNTGNSFSQRSRGVGFSFTIDKPRNMDQAVQAVRSGIKAKGGTFEGNEQQGNFRASGITGQYNVSDRVSVNINEKPALIPNSLIEKEVRSYFVGK